MSNADWQPIRTAPKDGTRVLLYEYIANANNSQIACDIGYWSTSVWASRGGGWIVYEARSDTLELSPTHWMPLPEPPKE